MHMEDGRNGRKDLGTKISSSNENVKQVLNIIPSSNFNPILIHHTTTFIRRNIVKTSFFLIELPPKLQQSLDELIQCSRS